MSDERLTKEQIKQFKNDALRYVCPHAAKNDELLVNGPKIFTRGEGCYVYDIEGRKYLDTFATLLTTICGHNRPEVRQAVTEQMKKLEFFPNYVDSFTLPLIKLAKKLAEITPGDLSVSFFVNSGSEANETAIKIAKQYQLETGKPKKWKIIARRFSYHGTTLGAASATGLPSYKKYLEPLLPGYIFAKAARDCECPEGMSSKEYGKVCLKELDDLIQFETPETIAGMIMDPVPGSNTAYPLPPEGYLQGVRKLCNEYEIVLIFDEVQTGFAKTGKMFACEHWDVTPDIITLGKGFTGGFAPLGAAVMTEKIYKVFKRVGHELRSGSTFGGHTLACAATLANIEIIEKENLVEKAAEMGKYLREGLEKLYKHSIVGDVCGIGMLLAVKLVSDRKAKTPLAPELKVGKWIRERCWQLGMILRNNGDILVIAPSLILSKDEADTLLKKTDQAISDAMKNFKF
ncbi:aspartate aminotransferase family protein [bacterium]|nr:aspartate aminotransferase family protein [bacterium]